jgi:hypothetical protein
MEVLIDAWNSAAMFVSNTILLDYICGIPFSEIFDNAIAPAQRTLQALSLSRSTI